MQRVYYDIPVKQVVMPAAQKGLPINVRTQFSVSRNRPTFTASDGVADSYRQTRNRNQPNIAVGLLGVIGAMLHSAYCRPR